MVPYTSTNTIQIPLISKRKNFSRPRFETCDFLFISKRANYSTTMIPLADLIFSLSYLRVLPKISSSWPFYEKARVHLILFGNEDLIQCTQKHGIYISKLKNQICGLQLPREPHRSTRLL
jgi:hypothetical protein